MKPITGRQKKKHFTSDEIMRLLFLKEAGFNNKEIGNQLGRSTISVNMKLRQFGGNPNYRLKKTKHRHLRRPVFEYFLSHNWEQTKREFKLTDSELKSIFTVGYRDPKLKHLRKDKRAKEKWTARELQFLIRHSGIKPREWIAKKLGRGNAHSCIKERLTKLGVSSRTLNGISTTGYRAAFNKEPRLSIQTQAGPGRGKHSATFFKIVPWVQLKKDLKDKYIHTKNEPLIKAIKTMGFFQE